MLAWLSQARGYSLLSRLTTWDAQHFLSIAIDGYTWSTHAGTATSPAFLPGYPSLIAGLHAVTGLWPPAAAILVSVTCGVIFACAIPHIVRAIPGTDGRAELVTVALVAVSPMSVVLTMAYSEALFCALASWALVFALRHRWWTAGTIGFFAGTVRISGLAIAFAFAVVAITTLIRERRQLRSTAVCAAIPQMVAATVAASGTIGWVLYSGLRMGSLTGWFAAQNKGWGSHFDFGVTTTKFVYRIATTRPNVLEVTTAVILIAACVLVIGTIRQGQPILLLAYGAAAVAEVVGSAGIMNSKIRLLIPAFTILMPTAAWLSRRQQVTQIFTLATFTFASTWLGGYALTIWKYAI